MTRGDNRIPGSSSVPAADFALDDDDNSNLQHLDVIHNDTKFTSKPLRGLRFAVIGAGPSGLLFAKTTARLGAHVTVFEKAGDPRKQHSGYINRSFNITITNVGRHVLADSSAWQNGIWLVGRAMHGGQKPDSVRYAPYGNSRESNIISIPRSVLRKNLVNMALAAGAEINFRSKVTHLDTDGGTVYYKDVNGRMHHHGSDLIIVGDGLHSIGNKILERDKIYGGTFVRPEPHSYITALINATSGQILSMQHIHFWHEPDGDAYTVGIPNGDGTVALLLTSKFSEFGESEYPFATTAQAVSVLRSKFPMLYAATGEQLVNQLPKRTRGFFQYKAASSYIVGPKAVLVGDAGCAFPPWAGFGANSAMYGASSLAYHLAAGNANIDRALSVYQLQQLSLSSKLMRYVNDQGEFFKGQVTKNPSARPDTALGDLIKEAQAEAAEHIPVLKGSVYDHANSFAISENRI